MRTEGEGLLVLPPMGQSAECEVEIDGKRDRGQVLLETAELIFRGTARLRVPFAAMKKVVAEAGSLRIDWRLPGVAKNAKSAKADGGTLVIPLGARAELWAGRIKNPPGRLDKLGVKPGMKIAVWGPIEPAAIDELRARAGAGVVVGKPKGGEALVFIAVDHPADLARITQASERMAPDGAVWVIRRKGKEAQVSEAESMAAGRAAGLYDTKVVAFSVTHTAERYVIPVAHRPPKTHVLAVPRKTARPQK
jgi:hypothetical protein